MRVYLASRYPRRKELVGYAYQIEEAGHTVTSRWLRGESESEEGSVDWTKETPMIARPFAEADIEDIRSSDIMVTFTEEPKSATRGGRHVEFGLALAWGIPVIAVGPRETIFHTLSQVRHFSEWGDSVIKAIVPTT